MLLYLIAKARSHDRATKQANTSMNTNQISFVTLVDNVNTLDGQLRVILAGLPGHLRHVGIQNEIVEAFVEVSDGSSMRQLVDLMLDKDLVELPVHVSETTEAHFAAKVPPAIAPASYREPE